MASPSALPADSDIKELQTLISGKKKESYLIPLLEKLFTCLVDTDKWLFLSELIGHDSKKVSRYAYYFLSSRHGVPQSPLSPMSLTKLKDLAGVDMKSAIPHRVVYALRLLESCTRIDEKDSILSKSLPELMDNLFGGQGESFASNDKDKKKKPSKSGTPSSSTLVAAECLVAYRTRFTTVDEALLKYFTKGLNHKEPIIARHASALLLRAVHMPNANITHLAKILLPHLGLDNVVVPNNKPGEDASAANLSKAASVESTMVLYGINRHDVSVRVNWVRICARFCREDAIGVDQKEKWLVELCDFLVDESDRVAFSAMEGIIASGWVSMSKATVTNPVSKVTLPVLQALKSRLIPSLASATTPVVHYAARIAKQLAQCYMKFFEAGSVGNTISPRRSASLHSLGIPGPGLTAPTGATGPVVQGLAVPAQPSGSAAHMRKGTVTGGAMGRGRTWTKTDTVPFDEEHPLKDVKGALHIVFRNHRSSFVRAQVLSALIWLEYSWSGFEVEDLLLKERYAAQPALLHDDVFNDFLERVLLSPQLVDTLLRVFFEHFTYAPAKLNIAILMKAWNSIMQLGEAYKTKVLNSIFAFLDHPVKKETRNIIHSVHKVIYWQLGEQGTILANEVCGELPKSSSIVNDEPHFPISNLATRAIVYRLEYAVNSSPWELRVICTEALAKFAFKASYPVRLRAYTFFKLVAKLDGAALYPVAAPFIHLLDRIFALRRVWASTYQSGAKLSLASLAQLTSEIDDLKADLTPYVVMGHLNPIGADLVKFLTAPLSNSSSSSGLASNKGSLRSAKLDLTPAGSTSSLKLESGSSSSSKDRKERDKDKERERDKDKDKEKEKEKEREKKKSSKSSADTVTLSAAASASASASASSTTKEEAASSTKTRKGRSGSVSRSDAPAIVSDKDKDKKSKKKE